MEYTEEQLNYYRICYVATNIIPQGLRSIFKQEWDKLYKSTLGEWKDEPRNGLDFWNRESPRNQRRNAHILATMVNGNRAEWDCTMLFYAILFSDCIHSLSPTVRSNVDDLRTFRNEEFAHRLQNHLSDVEFQNAISKVHAAFEALGISTLQIQDIRNQTGLPTEELRGVLKKVEELQEKETDLQENEGRRQVLEDQLQSDISPFYILPSKPSHDVAGRDSEVAEITQRLKELKSANENSLSYLYISGNPGSGKSQLAGLIAKRFFDEVKEIPSAASFVMTLNAENPDTLLKSYVLFAQDLQCSEYRITNILNSKDLKTDEKITSFKTLISKKIKLYTSWLLVVDNVTSISRVHAHLPESGNELWARGQLLITTQDTASIPSTNSFIQHISVSKGMEPHDASSLLAMLSGIASSEIEKEVAQALDYQPLALASAATYVRQVRLIKSASNFGWNDFLKRLDRGRRSTTEAILAETNPSYQRTMTAAITLAVEEQMTSDNCNVIFHTFRFLHLCAPQSIRLDIVINYILNVDEETKDKELIRMRIQRCSLLLLEEEESGVYIRAHQIVLDVLKQIFHDDQEGQVLKDQFLSKRSIPLYILARGDEAKAAYQRALEIGKTKDKRVKVLLIGQDRVGKTSVVRSLKGEEFRKDESSTEGVKMEKPLKHVGAKPWKNSTEEQETTAFDHKSALYVSDHLSTASSEGKALGKEDITEKIAESSVDDELHEPQEKKTTTKDVATHVTQDAAEPEYGNPDEISSKKREKTKRKDDIPDKVTRLAIKNLSQEKSDNDDGIWPVIWDFAGQAIFRAIHPIFVSREAIYVLVLDLTKELSAIAQCCVKEPDHEEAKIPAPDSNDTNLDHILRWMDLVHCFKHRVSGETLPPVILVGTHADLLQDPSDKITKVEDKIRHTARVFSDHIIRKTFVNNTLAGKQEEDPKIVSLREEILKVGEGMPHTKDDVPLKWLQVENKVYDLARKETNYITREDFKVKICDEICQFETEKDFEFLLLFLHDRGTVVYHGCADDKCSLVVLNPNWLVDILCQIITVDKQSEDKARIRSLREDLEMTGILHAELLNDSCDRLKLRDIKDSLLYIMKKFNLLCEYTSKEGSSIYLVPCMLTLSPDELKLNISGNQNPAPVYITFNTKYIPAGLFCRLLVLFMEYAQRIHSDQPELSANYAHFFIGEFTGIKFVCYKRVIKVLVWDHSNSNKNPVEKEPHICLKLLSVLKDSLKSLHEECHWLEAVSWDLCARCNLCPPELASKTTGECFWHGEKECCHDDCAHYVSVTKKLVRCSRTKGTNRCPPKTWCQALEDASRHNQDEVPDKEQPSSVEATIPAKVARTGTVMKEGTPSTGDLLELSKSIAESWMDLGHCLEVSDAQLDEIDDRRKGFTDKAYRMLKCWKEKNGSDATYWVLKEALCHKCVNRRDLAEGICYRAT